MSLLSTFKHSLWRILTERMHLDFKLRSGISVIVRNYADWCTYNDLFVNAEYTEAITDAITEWGPVAAQERLCVLDLGANMGYFSLQLADIFLQKCSVGKLEVCLFEASPKVTEELKRRVLIGSDRVGVQIVNGLVGKREGSARLNLGKEDTVNFVGDAADGGQWEGTRGAETVRYVDLNSATADMAVIHLIKCDIEGSEFAFIENYADLLKKTRRVVIEFHSHFGDIAEATETLRNMGFSKVLVLRDSTLSPTVYFART